MRKLLIRFARHDAGATSIEYALIASLVAVAIVSAVTVLRGDVVALYESVAGAFS